MVKIIKFLNRYLKYIKIELATEIIPMKSLYDPNSPHYRGTSINPSTGLPISGSVDASGATYASYNDDYHRRSSAYDDCRRNDYYNSLNSYNSSSGSNYPY